jgi:hypothetical protein
MVKEILKYNLGDIVEMKRPHPCASRSKIFKITRIGADLKITCQGCGHVILITRDQFNKRLKKVITENKILLK